MSRSLSILVCALIVAVRAAAVPLVIPHQGYLLDAQDQPVDATLSVRVALFPGASAPESALLWSTTQNVTIAAGYFSLLLGDTSSGGPALPSSLFDGSDLYLGLRVGGVDLEPRVRLASTGYALRAGVAESVAAGSVGTAGLVDGAVTGSKLADLSVTGAKVADLTLTGGKFADLTITGGKFADLTITGGKVADLTITGGKLADLTLTGGKLADLTITGDKLADLTITNGKIVSLDAAKLTGTLPGGLLSSIPFVAPTATTAPASPVVGQMYWNPTTRTLSMWDGLSWSAVMKSQTPVGTGVDGPLVVSGNTTLNPTRSSATATGGTSQLVVGSGTGFVAGQKLFVQQTLGTNAGQWELADLTVVAGNTLTLSGPLTGTYTNAGADRAQVMVVPQYTDVTIASGAVLSGPAWDGSTGGLLALYASGTVTVASGGRIAMDGKGYRGGSGGAAVSGTGGSGGETWNGTGGAGAAKESCTRGAGGGAGDGNCAANSGGTGAGGGGGDGTSNNDDGGGAGGGGGYGGGGGGGGSGGGCGGNGSGGGGTGGGTGQSAGGGGGWGCPGGNGGGANAAGGGSSPGGAGSGTTGGGGGGGGVAGYGGGGGGGGGTYGDSALTKIFFGGGGAGGGGSGFTGANANGGAGGAGGGVVFVAASTLSLGGTISADGSLPTTPSAAFLGGGGGSGAGGSVLVRARTSSGAGTLSAAGGAAVNVGGGIVAAGGGGGGVGRIRFEYGTGTVPAASPSATTGTFNP